MPAYTLVKGDTVDQTKVDYRDALAVNMYAIPRNTLGSAGYMQQIHGLTQLGTSSGVSRGGLWVSNPDFEGHYRVQGTDFVEVSETGTTTVLGTVTGTEDVTMTFTFNNVVITNNGNLYYYNPTDGFRQITDDSAAGSIVGSPTSATYVSSIVMLVNGNRIQHSAFSPEVQGISGEEYYATDADTIPEFTPDELLAVRQAENDECIVFKKLSSEHFVLTGGTGFAFQPLNQKATRQGVSGNRAMALLNGRWFVLGRRNESAPSCYIYQQGQSQKIASREIEIILSKYSDDDLESVTIDAFVEDDIEFVIFHLPNETLMFNATIAGTVGKNSAWTLLKSDAQGDTTYRAKDFVFDPRIGKFVVGDKFNGTIGIFDDSVSTHYGDIAEWILYSPLVKLETGSMDKLEIETIAGITDSSDDATVHLSVTQDLGRTYPQERQMTYGAQYDYWQRFILYRAGYVRDTVGFRWRGASRSRMAFGLFDVEVS